MNHSILAPKWLELSVFYFIVFADRFLCHMRQSCLKLISFCSNGFRSRFRTTAMTTRTCAADKVFNFLWFFTLTILIFYPVFRNKTMSAFFIAFKNILHSMNNSNIMYQFINYPIYRLSSFYLRNAVKGIGTGAGSHGVRFAAWSNRLESRQRLAIAASFFGAVLPIAI